MKTRLKLPQIPEINSRDEAESVMTELAQTINNQRKLLARRDAQVLTINALFESGLAECDQAVKLKTEQLRAWAETNPDQFPKGRKSLDLVSGILGFRTGTPKLALLSRSWTWEKVLTLVAQIMPHYIRSKMEVDKETMINDYAMSTARDITADKFQRVGLRVTQDESFYIEPKLTDTDARQTQEAA